MRHEAERFVDCVAGTAAGLWHQVPVQVHRRRDRPVAEPAGNLGDRHSLSKGSTWRATRSRHRTRGGGPNVTGVLVAIEVSSPQLGDGEDGVVRPGQQAAGVPDLPGSQGRTAARIWGIIGELEAAGLIVLAGKGYTDAGEHVLTRTGARIKESTGAQARNSARFPWAFIRTCRRPEHRQRLRPHRVQERGDAVPSVARARLPYWRGDNPGSANRTNNWADSRRCPRSQLATFPEHLPSTVGGAQ